MTTDLDSNQNLLRAFVGAWNNRRLRAQVDEMVIFGIADGKVAEAWDGVPLKAWTLRSD